MVSSTPCWSRRRSTPLTRRPPPEAFWEEAGRIGYGEALFRSRRVERHVVGRQWEAARATADRLGLTPNASVLELGCGDGQFAAEALAAWYGHVDAMDKSAAAIARARQRPVRGRVRFEAVDIATHVYPPAARWDGAFLMGVLHHVKPHAPSIVARLAAVAPRVIVLEPNGDHPLRRVLERLPSYRAAGEASFRRRRLVALFETAGYRLDVRTALNLFPPFTPDLLFPAVRLVERVVEASPLLRYACSSYVLGFRQGE